MIVVASTGWCWRSMRKKADIGAWWCAQGRLFPLTRWDRAGDENQSNSRKPVLPAPFWRYACACGATHSNCQLFSGHDVASKSETEVHVHSQCFIGPCIPTRPPGVRLVTIQPILQGTTAPLFSYNLSNGAKQPSEKGPGRLSHLIRPEPPCRQPYRWLGMRLGVGVPRHRVHDVESNGRIQGSAEAAQ